MTPGSLAERRREAIAKIEELCALIDSYPAPARYAELQRLRGLVDSIDAYLERAA